MAANTPSEISPRRHGLLSRRLQRHTERQRLRVRRFFGLKRSKPHRRAMPRRTV